jgi:hypothetical protein
MFYRVVSPGDPSRRMFDDGARMHKYLLCTVFGTVVVPPSDPKDLFMECVNIFTAQITELIWVGLIE